MTDSITRFFTRFWQRPSVRVALVLFVVFRILTAGFATYVYEEFPPKRDTSTFLETAREVSPHAPLRPLLEPWRRWDTGWYLFIAEHGYEANLTSIIFPPLYPWLIKAGTFVLDNDGLLAALVISNIACFFALVLFYELVAMDFAESIALNSVALMLIFPAGFFLFAGYTESLFLAFGIGAWIAARKEHYWWSGILAFLATLARTQGWVLAIPIGYLIYIQPTGWLPDLRNFWDLVRKSPAVIGGPLAAACYLFGMEILGLGSVSEKFAEDWEVKIAAPWVTVATVIERIFGGHLNHDDIITLCVFVFVLILAILATRRLEVPYWSYVWVSLFFIFTRDHDERVFHGLIRYTVSMFPLFIMLALIFARPGRLTRVLRVVYCVVGILMQLFFIFLFAQWGWVS